MEEECFWVPIEWLKSWIKGDLIGKKDEEKAISTQDLLCSHKKLDFKKIDQMKRITPVCNNKLLFFFVFLNYQQAWEKLKNKYPLKGEPLSQESYCLECVLDDVKGASD